MLDARDPCGFITVPPSTVVRVTGTARQDINGLLGIVESFNVERERYLVHMTRSQSTMALRKENLAKASLVKSYQAQWEQLRNDTRVQEKMSNYLNLLRQYVYPLALSQAIGGVLAIFLLLVYVMGFVNTIVSASSIYLIALMADPGPTSDPNEVFENFPELVRSKIENHFPMMRGKLSNRIAACILFCLFAVCSQSLFSINVGKELKQPEHTIKITASDRTVFGRYYNLGYEDAIKGRLHGSSLTEELESQTKKKRSVEEVRGGEEAFGEVNSGPKPRQPRYTRLTNLGSVLYLYKSIINLGTDQSTNLFSVGQLAANIQHHTEWWKKALLVISLYNVLRIFW